jgi:hypothetical protein
MAYKLKHKKQKKSTLNKIWAMEKQEENKFYNQKP